MTKPQIIWSIFFVFVAVLAIIGINYAIKRKKARAIFPIVEEKIDEDVGTNGADITSQLFNVKPDANYANADSDAKTIFDAKGLLWDDNDAVFTTLGKKTKGQLAAINNSMEQLYGETLDLVIKDIFGNCYYDIGPDCGNYNRAMTIIKSAK